jgi:hypothetical protein
MTIKEKKELYTILWKEARRLYSKYDLCGIKKYNYKSCESYQQGRMSSPFCCNYCQYISKKGCTVQSLSCSFCACFFGLKHFPFECSKDVIIIQKRIWKLKLIAKKYDIPMIGRASKKESFNYK